jgi:hypothetical protein
MKNVFASKARLFPLIFLVAAVVVVIVTVALGAWLDGDAGWTQATAGVGLAATVVAAGVLLATAQGWANGARFSLVAITTAVVGLGAVGLTVVTYVGSAGDVGMGGESNVVAQDTNDEADVAAQSTTDEGIALSEQVSNNEIQPPGYAHDVGRHPAFNDFVSMEAATVLSNSPGGTLLPNEVELLQEQLTQARAFAEAYDTVEKAQAAGFNNTTNDVPFMGAHFLNMSYVLDGVFDPAKPEGLLFSKLGAGDDAEWQLVGVWYLLFPGVNPGVTETIPPEGFAGNLDLWHEHEGLCTRDGIISENNSRASCVTDSGNFIGDLRWMIHVWVWPETGDNPEGVFTYLNANLFEMQQQGNVQGEPLGGFTD